MDKYCVDALNHLEDTSINLFDPKDPTIKNENFIYSKTEDLHCKVEEDDVLVSKNTHGVIENLTACKSTNEVANLKNEFIPEVCLPDETVVAKIEITEHPLEFGTIQELEQICRNYNANVADEGTETSQISKICELDKSNGRKTRKKTKDQKGKVQTNTMYTFLHKARGGVNNRKRNISDGLFVRLERIDISDKLLATTKNSTSSTIYSARTNNENNLGTDQETPKGLKLNKLPKQVGNSHQLNIKKPEYTINETESLKIVDTLKKWLNKDKLLVERTLETSRGSIPCGRQKKMSRDIKTNKNKGTFGRNRNRTPKTGVEDMEQQEIDMEEEVIREEYKCHDCNKVLISRRSLKHHIKQCHEEVNTPTFQCYHCNKIVKQKRSLILHLRQWHTEGDKLFHCDSCLYKTNLQQALELHVYRVHVPNDQKPSFKCKLCPHEAKFKANLRAHINKVHLRKIKTKKCNQCDWVGNGSNFSQHVRSKHLLEEFICDKCNQKTSTKANLVTHQLIHSKAAKRFTCSKCTYQTHYKSRLKAHLKYHEDNFQSCPECSQLVQEANFYYHIRNHQRDKLKVKKKCPECGKEVFWLSKHMLTHAEGKVRIQCPECSFSAVNRRYLKQHRQKYHGHHEEQKSFICYHCNKEVVSRGGLIYHLRAVHTDDSCECHICGKKLKSKLYLSGHVRKIHDNVKWFECDLCPEETRYRTKHVNNLRKHRVLHLNKDEVIMYKCEYCPYEAKVPGYLQKHVRKYHSSKLKGRRTHSI